jgi:hypothetical protein
MNNIKMKKTILIILYGLAITGVMMGQTKSSKESKLEAQIIDIEKAGWNAFKTKDPGWFESNTTDDYLQITAEGTSTKTDVIHALDDCNLKSFKLDDFMLVKLNKSALILIYTATQDGMCEGSKLPDKVKVAVNYVRRGGKWLEAFYMDTPVE